MIKISFPWVKYGNFKVKRCEINVESDNVTVILFLNSILKISFTLCEICNSDKV